MKSTLLISLAIVCSMLALAQDPAPYLVKEFGANINSTEVSTSGGSIQVIHDAGQRNRVEVYIHGNNDKQLSKEEIGQRLQQDYEFTVEASGNKVIAKAKRKSNSNDWKNGLSISFRLYVPEKTNNELATSGGSISLSGLDGEQEFATSGGSINLQKMKGKLEGATSGGSITIQNSQGNAELATSGGSINASDCTGKLELKTSGGSLKLANLNGEIDAATSGGSVEGNNIAGTLKTATSGGNIRLTDMKCTLDAATSSGSIRVEMTALGKHVRLSNSGGNIQLAVPANKGMNLSLQGNTVEVNGMQNFSGSQTSKEVKGTINGGGIEVSAKTSGGKVTLGFTNQ
jgi:hypothetical protein